MIITCEKCKAKFNLDENLLKQTGSKVRCSKCQNIFPVYPPTEMEKPAKPDEEVVEHETIDSDVGTESVKQVEVSEEQASAALEAEGKEFDLSDLDLEEEIKPEPEVEEEHEELLGLELDTEPVAEEKPEDSEAVLETKEEELDLSDIEKMLDIEETPEPETKVKEEPEEVEEEAEPETGVKEEIEELGLELDLDTEPVTEKTPEEAEKTTEEAEKTTEEAEEEPEPEAEAKEKPEKHDPEFELKGVDEEETKKEAEETVDLGSQADQPEAEEVEKTKKRISTPVLVALIIALLTGGAYGTYVVLKSMDIKIPFISDLVEPAVQDEFGILKITTFDIADKFIDNSKSGKLFIISGKIKNGFPGTRSFIRVTGKLYTKKRVLSKTATIYCGNVLSDQDLSDMDMNSINKRLLNSFGDNKSNVNVKPGKELPFMMVFPNIPDNIKEYTVEVAGSLIGAHEHLNLEP